MIQLTIAVASGAELSVRRFASTESISTPYTVSVWARSRDAGIDLSAIAGQEASFTVDAGQSGTRTWNGICSYAQQMQGDESGLSTYFFRIVPTLWLLQERSNHRIYQHMSLRQIAEAILDEWRVPRKWKVEEAAYPPLEFKVQWGESDYTFLCRILEEAGISFSFVDNGTTLLLSDAPEAGAAREGAPIPWVEQPPRLSHFQEYMTAVGLRHQVRAGALVFSDYDFRRPAYQLSAAAPPAGGPDEKNEQYLYVPGSMSRDVDLGHAGPSPVADDRGWVRHEEDYGKQRAQRALEGERAGRRAVGFEANVLEIAPGTIFELSGHPHDEVASNGRLLVTDLEIEADARDEPRATGKAAFAVDPWKPRLRTPRPKIRGVHAAMVVGPPGDEIAPDEYGRVRVQFPWDREGQSDEFSSVWMHVAAPWGGLGYGFLDIPRVGHEVLVDFLDGDPDRPIIVGRVFNATHPVPYKLPDNKTRSTWKSDSTPGSGGFNEIMYEDKAGDELVYLQAEKNLRKLVKNDETITVGNDREKHVLVEEMDATGVDRSEVVKQDRTQATDGNAITRIDRDRKRWVKQNRNAVTDEPHMRLVMQDHDAVTKGKKRDRVDEEAHLIIEGNRLERIDGDQMITVGEDRHEQVGDELEVEAGRAFHAQAGESVVGIAPNAVTLKGAGGFIQIDDGGVTIVGNAVKINAGGSPGSAPTSNPKEPEEPREADVKEPARPELPQKPKPLPEKDPLDVSADWIEIALVEEDDPKKAVPFVRYRVDAPNGKTFEGRLDAAGKALVIGIPSGSCKVTFPDLDGSAWS